MISSLPVYLRVQAKLRRRHNATSRLHRRLFAPQKDLPFRSECSLYSLLLAYPCLLAYFVFPKHDSHVACVARLSYALCRHAIVILLELGTDSYTEVVPAPRGAGCGD
jgi:hypothetical protein